MPAGAQQASCSICTRAKGENAPRPTRSRSILERVQAALLVAPAQIPDGVACHLQVRGKHVNLRLVALHREKDPRAASDTLLDSAVSHEHF